MPGRKFTSTTNYRYGFNGKEEDDEVKGDGNQQDYGMRIYDPRLGRFLSVDPLTKEYPELTPYQFASNSPIDGVDLDGLERYDYRLVIDKGKKPVLTHLATAERKPTLGEAFLTLFGYKNFSGERYEKQIHVVIEKDRQVTNVIYFQYFKELQDWQASGYPLDASTKFQPNTEIGDQTTLQLQMMTLGQQIDLGDGDIDGYASPSLLPKKNNTTNNSTNSQSSSVHNGNISSANANSANKTGVAKPKEAYDRVKHYGKTPTAGDRTALGATSGQDIDHTIPLVKHYYEGDGINGVPGWKMSDFERKMWAQFRGNMTVQPQGKNRSEGGKLSQYSKDKKKEYNLQSSKQKKK